MLSLHTSPLAQPGVGDSGGMNVYVRELVAGLAHAGVEVTTYTREWRAGLPREILVEPNHRVIHIPAGQSCCWSHVFILVAEKLLISQRNRG